MARWSSYALNPLTPQKLKLSHRFSSVTMPSRCWIPRRVFDDRVLLKIVTAYKTCYWLCVLCAVRGHLPLSCQIWTPPTLDANDIDSGHIASEYCAMWAELIILRRDVVGDPGTYTCALLLPFYVSKAVDRIKHEISLEKLRLRGLHPHLIRWRAEFILDRTEMVQMSNKLYSTKCGKTLQ